MNLFARARFVIEIIAAMCLGAQPALVQSADTSLPPVTVNSGQAQQQFSRVDGMVLKNESFDRDPGWLGVNNRSATTRDPIKIRQDFGYSPETAHAGGRLPGEFGGFVTPAGEAAFYGKVLDPARLDQPLSATGKMTVGKGGTHLLLGFFNSRTVNEWRTPNTIAIRLNGRGEKFFAYVESFDRDPRWDGWNNRRSTETRMVRPWFDFGFSDTNYAGGIAKGELGGQVFRGDCRDPRRMACYGDRVENLKLDQPLKASGKIAMTRGVSDSTTLFGFYHSHDSMRKNESQKNGVPESVMGIHIEGPSRDGFKFYPVLHAKGRGSTLGQLRDFSNIYPDHKSHDWSLEYNPQGAEGKGQVVVTLDGKSGTIDLQDGDKAGGTTFDRFGIVTSWIDGNSQDVYLDDITYTHAQK